MKQLGKHYNRASKFLCTLRVSIEKALLFNLFASLIALPFTIAWGLPLSIVSPIGNLLLAPLLTAFLIASSLVFFCELVGLNFWILDTSLELVAKVWSKILSLGSDSWLAGIPTPNCLWILAAIPIAALIIIHLKSLLRWQAIVAMIVLHIATASALRFITPTTTLTPIRCARGEVYLVRSGKYNAIIDVGAMSTNQSSDSWVEYELASAILKSSGRLDLDHLIVLRSTKTALVNAVKICNKFNVGEIRYAAHVGQHWNRSCKVVDQSVREMRKKANARQIGERGYSLRFGDSVEIKITPKNKVVPYGKCGFNQLGAEVTLSGKTTTLPIKSQ